MNEPAPPSLTGRHKAFLIGGIIVALAGAAAIVLLRPGASSCQGVFEQTAPRLEANIELIRNKGGFAVSQEKVQELTDGAQKVGLHLKTCCSVLEGGKLNPEQFQQCVERASAYEKHIAEVAQQVDTAATAQQQGNTAILQQQTSQIAQTLQSAASEVVALEQQITHLAPAAGSAPGAGGGTEREPNDTKDSATELRINTRMNGGIARTDDSDYFKFTSGKPVRDRVIAKLENRSETLRPSITLFGPDKAQLQNVYNGTPGADAELAFTAEPGKQYFLRVDPYDTTGAYTLSVAAQNAHDVFEPNDDPARHAPTPLAAGKSIDAGILDAQDDDWYVLKAAPGSTLRLRLENRSTTLRPSVIVYNAQRSQLHNPYDGTPGASLDFSFDTTPGMTYFFRVSPYDTHGAYRLTVN